MSSDWKSQLLSARSSKNLSIEECSEKTKIPLNFLIALESGDLKSLPKSVYSEFHLKKYFLFLGVDSENCLRELKKVISDATFNEPSIPIVSNYDATLRSNPDEIKKALTEQIDNPVLWLDSVRTLGKINNNFIEIGPKKVLSGIIKKIDELFHISSFNSYNDVEEYLDV